MVTIEQLKIMKNQLDAKKINDQKKFNEKCESEKQARITWLSNMNKRVYNIVKSLLKFGSFLDYLFLVHKNTSLSIANKYWAIIKWKRSENSIEREICFNIENSTLDWDNYIKKISSREHKPDIMVNSQYEFNNYSEGFNLVIKHLEMAMEDYKLVHTMVDKIYEIEKEIHKEIFDYEEESYTIPKEFKNIPINNQNFYRIKKYGTAILKLENGGNIWDLSYLASNLRNLDLNLYKEWVLEKWETKLKKELN